MKHPFAIFREEAGGDAGDAGGNGDAGGGGGGIAATLNQGNAGGGDAAAAAAAGSGDAGTQTSHVFYGEDGAINPAITALLGDEDAAITKMLEKYQATENPNRAMIDGIKNLQFLSGQKDIDAFIEGLPDDAPQEAKDKRSEMIRKINGAPDKAEDYGLKRPDEIAASVYWPEGIEMQHMELAKQYSVPREFLQKQFELHTNMLNGAPAHFEAQYQGQLKTQLESLRTEHGTSLQGVVDAADNGGMASGHFNGEEMAHVMRAVTQVGLGQKFVNMMKWINDSIGEDKRVFSQGQGNQGSLDDFGKAKDIVSNPQNPLYDKFYAGDADTVNMVSSLNQAGHDKQKK